MPPTVAALLQRALAPTLSNPTTPRLTPLKNCNTIQTGVGEGVSPGLWSNIDFEWDASKAVANLKKHGVSFAEVATVFEDAHAYVQDDTLNSDEEPRQVILGYSDRHRLQVVSFVQRAETIRLITARAATSRERTLYEE